MFGSSQQTSQGTHRNTESFTMLLCLHYQMLFENLQSTVDTQTPEIPWTTPIFLGQ